MKKIILLLCFALSYNGVMAEKEVETTDYRRSSLYNILINHTDQKFAGEIGDVFVKIPTSDKYNDHNLSVRVVSTDSKEDSQTKVDEFIKNNHIASHMVARWFNRDPFSGVCNVELVKSRGLYDANEFDKEMASRSKRGIAMLEDAGEDLIGNTFLMVNDIRYIDREKAGKALGGVLRVMGALADAYMGNNQSTFSDLGDNLGSMMETLKGFKVKVHTYLYQLKWDEETSMTFYKDYYTAKKDEERVKAFDANRGKFVLEYVGDQSSSGKDVSFIGVNLEEPEIMIRKACQRAIDENISSLQKNFEVFKVKVPLLSVAPLTADIGMKEGVTAESRYEVLESVMKDGKIVYEKVGVIKPVPNMIWDNRYMASEEGAVGADLKRTTFKKVSGKDFYPGMLIREIK